jgi:hypothetical protein
MYLHASCGMRRIPNFVSNKWNGYYGKAMEAVSVLGYLGPHAGYSCVPHRSSRTQKLPLFLTDGWKAYTAALLQVQRGSPSAKAARYPLLFSDYPYSAHAIARPLFPTPDGDA